MSPQPCWLLRRGSDAPGSPATIRGLPATIDKQGGDAQTLETKPGIRVLRVSSGPAWRDEPASVTSADTPHIRRPFTALELREKLRVLLQPVQRR